MTMNDLARAAINVGGYLMVAASLLLLIRELAHKLIDKLIAAIREDTKAKVEGSAAMAKLSEKIDALAKRNEP